MLGSEASRDDFFFGVTYGQNSVEGAKLLIDKVRHFTNLFIVNSYEITSSANAQNLTEICRYAADANLHFIVYFFSFVNSTWGEEWLDMARQTWGDKFLGVYLRDEPGGRQIDFHQTVGVGNASSYAEAADLFVKRNSETPSMLLLKDKEVRVFISDYALYWFDYRAGFDTIFVEMGWNHSETQHIALGRGAANLQGKEWGNIITWTYENPPYLESPQQILDDMITGYQAGAKYMVLFNYPVYPEANPYGRLTEEHFRVMRDFWTYINARPRNIFGRVEAQAVFVLPKDYGWGMRKPLDNIWGLWPADEKAPLIWESMNKLIAKYGLSLDMVYDDNLNLSNRYSEVYFWNSSID